MQRVGIPSLMLTLRLPWNELPGATETRWTGTLLLPRNSPSGAIETWWLVSRRLRHRRFIPGMTEQHHQSQEHTPQMHLVALPVANQPPRLYRPRQTIPGAKERTCPLRLRRPWQFIPGKTERHHQSRNTHPPQYPIIPKKAEEK